MNEEELKQAAVVMFEVAARLEAGQKVEVEWRRRNDTDSAWANLLYPSWNWDVFIYRIKPQPKVTKYLCYADGNGFLIWRAECNKAPFSGWKRLPEFDKEPTE